MNIVILGGGIAGLLGAYAMRHTKPVIIEAGPHLGGNFLAGGLKYIHDTPEVRQLLRELELPFKAYKPRGALWWDGVDRKHPDFMASIDPLVRYQIQLKHWVKTRGTDLGFRHDCMNDPMGNHAALRCDHMELLKRLEQRVRAAGCEVRLGSKVTFITERHVCLNEGMNDLSIGYDVLVPTLPLGMIAKMAPWTELPSSEATKLAIFEVESGIDIHPDWDYMYTPEAKYITRLVQPEPHAITAEVPWHLPQSDHTGREVGITTMEMMPDIMDILRDTFKIEGVCTSARLIPGHLRPLERQPEWRSGWYPLGRFAQWDSRATADKVYARALSVAQNIGIA